MKLSTFLTAVGFLTLSVAVPAPTPISATELNTTPASVTMTSLETAMPESTPMPKAVQLEFEYDDKSPIKWKDVPRKMRIALAATWIWMNKLAAGPDDPIKTATRVNVAVKTVS